MSVWLLVFIVLLLGVLIYFDECHKKDRESKFLSQLPEIED